METILENLGLNDANFTTTAVLWSMVIFLVSLTLGVLFFFAKQFKSSQVKTSSINVQKKPKGF